MVGSLPFIPDASEMQLEEGMMGSKESDAIISDMKSSKDSEEVVLIQYRVAVCGREIRAQVGECDGGEGGRKKAGGKSCV